MNPKTLEERLTLVSWLVIPLILVWFTTGYLMNINKTPDWGKPVEVSQKGQVLGESSDLSIQDIEKIKWHNEGLITFWFDDAWESQFAVAFPKLDEEKMVAALSVPTKMIGYDDYASWYQIKLLQYKGWEIASHTRNHSCKPNEQTDADVEDELVGSLKDLNDQGLRVTSFVTPCGAESATELNIAKEYYSSLRTTVDGINELPVQNPYNLKVQAVMRNTTVTDVEKWVEEAKNSHAWLILMFHQIDNKSENNFGTDYKTFNQIVNLVKDSGLSVVTPTQALQLVVDDQTVSTDQAIILYSSLGYVRVRLAPDMSKQNMIGKVKENEKYPILEEQTQWYKLDLSTSESSISAEPKEGWVNKQYARKITNEQP